MIVWSIISIFTLCLGLFLSMILVFLIDAPWTTDNSFTLFISSMPVFSIFGIIYGYYEFPLLAITLPFLAFILIRNRPLKRKRKVF